MTPFAFSPQRARLGSGYFPHPLFLLQVNYNSIWEFLISLGCWNQSGSLLLGIMNVVQVLFREKQLFVATPTLWQATATTPTGLESDCCQLLLCWTYSRSTIQLLESGLQRIWSPQYWAELKEILVAYEEVWAVSELIGTKVQLLLAPYWGPGLDVQNDAKWSKQVTLITQQVWIRKPYSKHLSGANS